MENGTASVEVSVKFENKNNPVIEPIPMTVLMRTSHCSEETSPMIEDQKSKTFISVRSSNYLSVENHIQI